MQAEQPQEQVESFADRVGLLRDRLVTAIRELDVRGQLEQHPWELVGAAALLGAWLGFSRPRPARARRELSLSAKLGDMVLTGLGALAFRFARDAALRQVGEVAKRWWDETSAPPRDTDVHLEEAPIPRA